MTAHFMEARRQNGWENKGHDLCDNFLQAGSTSSSVYHHPQCQKLGPSLRSAPEILGNVDGPNYDTTFLPHS